LEGEDFLAGRRGPNLYLAIGTGGGQPCPVGAERRAHDDTLMAEEFVEGSSRCGVPHDHGFVMIYRGELRPVWAEYGSQDRVRVSREDMDRPDRGHVPDDDHLIPAARYQARSV